jgi:hypothetical protein
MAIKRTRVRVRVVRMRFMEKVISTKNLEGVERVTGIF